ncbi:MAG TPA: hypothetical protein VGQ99_03580 [Tepidisphaeraceae bacterium]|jgi:hypothetical protein|nr:hypothetical protein [Tepidisphaeraceae bacterium]
MVRPIFKLLAVLLALLPAAATAKVNLQVDIGWNGAFRAGRWAPVYITASDDAALPARNVIIEIMAPHDKTFALKILNPATIRPDPSTVLVYVPLTFQLEDTIAVIRDAGSFRKLAEQPFDSSNRPDGRLGRVYYGSGGGEILLGVSGVSQHGLSVLKGQFRWADENTPAPQPGQPVFPPPDIQIGYLEPRMLPDAKVGYECLDALVLAAADIVNMSPQRQGAIAAWVRGGGRLIFWASDGPIPADSPIIELLPGEIGSAQTINLTLVDTKAAGLASRVENVPARKITPAPDAQKLDLFAGKGAAYFGRAGMGQVALLSFDASKLTFADTVSGRKFWRPIFHRTLKAREERPQNNYYGFGNDPSETRRLAAAEKIIDRLGNVPGVGRFDFSYVALVMIAMMLIVGPVDWFILRKLGRQEWTWVTTGGWIALITFGALYVGHVLKSGDLHYRTVRVIDQADDKVVGVLDIIGIYSPKTQAYNLDGPRECWWEPANVDFQPNWRQTQRTTSTIDMFQNRFGQKPLTRTDSNGNRVPAMVVNVWNLRFMQSELGDPGSDPPPISSSLQLVKVGNELRIRGTITNRNGLPLQSITIATKAGAAHLLNPIAANQMSPIDAVVEPSTFKPVDISQYQPYYYYGGNQQNPYSAMSEDLGFIGAATDMAADRSQRLIELLSTRDDLACIYGVINNAPPAVKLEQEEKNAPKEQHWQVIRALAPLGK